MLPADVAEHLMRTEKRDAAACLEGLVVALRNAKDGAAMDKAAKSKIQVVEIVHDE